MVKGLQLKPRTERRNWTELYSVQIVLTRFSFWRTDQQARSNALQ